MKAAGLAGDRYTFGDSDLAAQRLTIVAEVFRATSERFLRDGGVAAPDLVVDLGCGPGYTTELVDETVHPGRLMGIDSSPAYVELASRRLGGAARILCADVLDLPGHVADVDLMFARFLLTHLADPVAAVARWLGRLSGRGVLMLEEVESITTEEPTFRSYLDLQRKMLEANRNRLEIGPIVDAAARSLMATFRSELATTTPPATAVARMFAMNFAVWRREPSIEALATPAELEQIASGLRARTEAVAAGCITWRLRHVVIASPT